VKKNPSGPLEKQPGPKAVRQLNQPKRGRAKEPGHRKKAKLNNNNIWRDAMTRPARFAVGRSKEQNNNPGAAWGARRDCFVLECQFPRPKDAAMKRPRDV
jgi:hypothetical protein